MYIPENKIWRGTINIFCKWYSKYCHSYAMELANKTRTCNIVVLILDTLFCLSLFFFECLCPRVLLDFMHGSCIYSEDEDFGGGGITEVYLLWSSWTEVWNRSNFSWVGPNPCIRVPLDSWAPDILHTWASSTPLFLSTRSVRHHKKLGPCSERGLTRPSLQVVWTGHFTNATSCTDILLENSMLYSEWQ